MKAIPPAIILAVAMAATPATGATTDSQAPVLTGVAAPAGPLSFDAAVNHFPIIEIVAGDNGTGVQFIECVFAPLAATGDLLGENEIYTRVLAERVLASGSLNQGRFSVEARVPRGTPAGDYQLRAIKLADGVGNLADYAADGSASALPMAQPFRFTVTGAGPAPLPTSGDTLPPTLPSLALAPTALGVAVDPGFFNITVGIGDDVSGVENIEVWMVSPSGVFVRFSTVGSESVITGDERGGQAHLRGCLPRHAESGPWRVARVGLSDRTGKTQLVAWENDGVLASATLLVYGNDDDGDGRLEDDLFPGDSTEWGDFDRDGIGDNADPDDDNDGMPDSWESLHGLNPLDLSDAGSDADGDGLSNLREFQIGTSPRSRDTDGDGLSDADEGSTHLTQPGNPDSDGDGYLDGTEVALGVSAVASGFQPAQRVTGALQSDGFAFDFLSRMGSTYRIEHSTNLTRWETLVEDIPGEGRPLSYLLPAGAPEGQFYRVVETRPAGSP